MINISKASFNECKQDRMHNLSISEIASNRLLISINGSINLRTIEEMYTQVKEYSISSNSRVDILLNSNNITSIDSDARLWLITNGKGNKYINRAICFGRNLFLENILLVLLNIISERNDLYRQFNNQNEALNWITTC